MKRSVIIPCFNCAGTIGEQLEALVTQEWSEPWEIVVADNGSTDGSVGIVNTYQERFPQLRVVDAFARRGPGHARNVGANAAAGDALAFCDADDVVGVGWVAAIGKALSVHDFVASRLDFEKLNTPQFEQAARMNRMRGGCHTTHLSCRMPEAAGSGSSARCTRWWEIR